MWALRQEAEQSKARQHVCPYRGRASGCQISLSGLSKEVEVEVRFTMAHEEISSDVTHILVDFVFLIKSVCP